MGKYEPHSALDLPNGKIQMLKWKRLGLSAGTSAGKSHGFPCVTVTITVTVTLNVNKNIGDV